MLTHALGVLGLDRVPAVTLAWTLVSTLVIYTAWKLWVYPEYFSPIRNIPGPSVGNSLLFGRQLEHFRDETGVHHARWFEKYGPVIQYRAFAGEQMIAISDEKAINYILMQKTNNFPKPPEEVRGLERLTGRGLLTVEGDIHKRQRRIMTPSFTQAQTNSYLPIFTEMADKLAANLDKVVEAETTSDGYTKLDSILNWLSKATLEVICTAGFDYHVGSLDQDEHELINAFNLMLRPRPLTPLLFLTIRLLNKLPLLAKLPLPQIKAAKASMALMKEESKAMLGDKLEVADSEELEGKKDLLSCIVRANKLSRTEKDKMKDDEIQGTVSVFLLAGHETSSTALTFLLHELSCHPDVQNKLRVELKEAYRAAESEGRSSLSAEQLSSLPYLDAVVRETLRVLPPVALTVREAVEDDVLPLSEPIRGRDGKMLDSLYLPHGQTVAIDIMQVNRNKQLFGDDANQFRPERWLDNEGQLKKQSKAFETWSPILSFLGGPRGCIGYRFALLEVKTIAAVLVNKFDFQPSGEKITFRTNIVMRPVLEGRIEEGAQLPLKIRRL